MGKHFNAANCPASETGGRDRSYAEPNARSVHFRAIARSEPRIS